MQCRISHLEHIVFQFKLKFDAATAASEKNFSGNDTCSTNHHHRQPRPTSSRARFTHRLYRLKPRASRSKGPPTNCGTHRVNCRYM